MRGWEDGPRRRRRLGAARLAGTHGWGPWDASQARKSSAKGKGRAWSSHRSLKRRGRDAGQVGGEIRQRRWTEFAVRGAGEFSEPRIPHESKRRDPVEVLRGQEGGEPCWRRGISVAGQPTRGGARPKSGRFRCCSGGWWPLGVSWYTGEAAAVVCRVYGVMVRRDHGGAEGRREAELCGGGVAV